MKKRIRVAGDDFLISIFLSLAAGGFYFASVGTAYAATATLLQKSVTSKASDFSKSRNPLHNIATWYSKRDRHVRRHTASGEVFDDSKQTCAVWDHPFGTHLKVTNLENKKSVICRVNDRGPARRFGRRRIDLSRAAFHKIANLHRGRIRVSVARVNVSGGKRG